MRRTWLSLVALVLSGGLAHAGSFTLDPRFTHDDFASMTEALADVLTFPNLATATPTGVAGFEVMAAAGGPQVDTGSNWWHLAPHANTVGGVLVGQRIILRKGLPYRLDVGAQFGNVMGEKFWGGEVRWALMEGGVVSPGASVRAAYSRLQNAPFDVEVAEAQIVASKGFAFVSPYAALGYRRVFAKASFGAPVPASHSADSGGWTGALGARVSVLHLVRLVGEFRPGTQKSVFIGLGVGL